MVLLSAVLYLIDARARNLKLRENNLRVTQKCCVILPFGADVPENADYTKL